MAEYANENELHTKYNNHRAVDTSSWSVTLSVVRSTTSRYVVADTIWTTIKMYAQYCIK